MIDPQWQGVFEKWSRNFVHQNFWRVRKLFGTEEDALQECALIFARCRKYYCHKINTNAHFMSLYKTAVFNDFQTFSTRDTRERFVLDQEKTVSNYAYPGDGPESAAAIDALSDEAKTVLATLADAPGEVINFIFSNPSREMVSRRLRRMCGIRRYEGDILAEIGAVLPHPRFT